MLILCGRDNDVTGGGGNSGGGYVSLRGQLSALQRQLVQEKEMRLASDDRAKHAEQYAF